MDVATRRGAALQLPPARPQRPGRAARGAGRRPSGRSSGPTAARATRCWCCTARWTASSRPSRSTVEYGGALVRADEFGPGEWSYVALGHYHVQHRGRRRASGTAARSSTSAPTPGVSCATRRRRACAGKALAAGGPRHRHRGDRGRSCRGAAGARPAPARRQRLDRRRSSTGGDRRAGWRRSRRHRRPGGPAGGARRAAARRPRARPRGASAPGRRRRCTSSSTCGGRSPTATDRRRARRAGGRRCPTRAATTSAGASCPPRSTATAFVRDGRGAHGRRRTRAGGGLMQIHRLRLVNFRQHEDYRARARRRPDRHRRAQRRGEDHAARGDRLGDVRHAGGARHPRHRSGGAARRPARRCGSSSTSRSARTSYRVVRSLNQARALPGRRSRADRQQPRHGHREALPPAGDDARRSSSTPTSPARRTWRSWRR